MTRKTDLILAIDQGTTGSTAVVVDAEGNPRGRANVEFPQHFPQPGWVEHEPQDIWGSVLHAIGLALERAGAKGSDVVAIGITNQRETTLVWDRKTGEPIHRAIVWQDRRTAEQCAALRARGAEPMVRAKTGLVLDPYFSGTKIAWLLDGVPGARARAVAGDLAFGTVETYLVHRLTGGAAHVTDVTNASRTLLLDLATLSWDDEMLELLGVPRVMLPRVVGCAEEVGRTRGVPGLPDGIVIAGMAGDQQAALFGQTCFGIGDVKCTYGTGAFVLMNVGSTPVASRHGLLTTAAWKLREGDAPVYALEGSAFIAGAAVQWLRDGLGIIGSASEVEALARSVPDTGGVAFVPALVGLGAPYWDADARGLICGITRGTTRAHLARATIDAIAQQTADLVEAMNADAGSPAADQARGGARSMKRMRVDGGASANGLLLELQASYAGVLVERPKDIETTARGAAMLAALGAGFASDVEALRGWSKPDVAVQPGLDAARVEAARAAWRLAVARARSSIAGG
ncbi:MAG: glycerol kinase GlpK [Deltaproteobacteria bacterium]|nr:glycerol kinase GlpK [Deltaproteobacteria bacterium]